MLMTPVLLAEVICFPSIVYNFVPTTTKYYFTLPKVEILMLVANLCQQTQFILRLFSRYYS